MKHGKLIIWLAAAAVCFGAASYGVCADTGITAAAEQGSDSTEDGFDFTYDTETKQAVITKYTGDIRKVEVPSKIGEYTVTKIGTSAFQGLYITSVTLPETITEIGESAFQKCYLLSTAELPGVQTVGNDAFLYCSSLKSISMPQVRTIGSNAFWDNYQLTEVSAPLAETIQSGAFCYCKGLTKVSLPNAVNIGSIAFSVCTALTEIELPKAEVVSSRCFEQCTALTKVALPAATVIERNAFCDCAALASVTMPEVETIGKSAFARCTALEELALPESTVTVDECAFLGCTALNQLWIQGATELQAYAFRDCTALTSVWVSDSSRTTLFYEAFVNCPMLEYVNGVQALSKETDSRGYQYPVLNPDIETAILNHFSRSINVKFVDEYCEALCNYIVATETDPWMTEAQKARQLHDWLIRHCEYENGGPGEYLSNAENHVASSVFLSYELNVRGEKEDKENEENKVRIGEAVCEGYAKAYAMLLGAADIKSFRVSSQTHQWVIASIDGKYYHIDPTFDDPIILISFDGNTDNTRGNPYSTTYTYFLKSSEFIAGVHDHEDPTPTTWDNSEHKLLQKFKGDTAEAMAQCTESYPDDDANGILDFDYDLDGIAGDEDYWEDLLAYQIISGKYFGYSGWEKKPDSMAELFTRLHRGHIDFWNLENGGSPQDVTVSAGDIARFSVVLFNNDVTCRWQYQKAGTDTWTNSNETAELCVKAETDLNGALFRCVITDKDGNTSVSRTATLTVIPKNAAPPSNGVLNLTAQPKSATAAVGSKTSFKVTAEGTGLTYQWQFQKSGSDTWTNSTATGCKTAEVRVTATEKMNGQKYRCIIKNSFGNTVTSSAATLKVTANITAQPKSVSAAAGSKAKFTVTAEGTGLTYQWQYYNKTTGKWTNSTLASAKTASLSVTASASVNGRKYRCVVKNSFGNTVNSSSAALTVV